MGLLALWCSGLQSSRCHLPHHIGLRPSVTALLICAPRVEKIDFNWDGVVRYCSCIDSGVAAKTLDPSNVGCFGIDSNKWDDRWS